MSEMFSKMEPGQLIGLVSVGGGFLVAIIAILSSRWAEIRKVGAANDLKQNMLDRGMSAEEIQTVLDAGTGRKSGCGRHA